MSGLKAETRSPWSSLVSAPASRGSFCVETCTKCHHRCCFHPHPILCHPAPHPLPVPYLYPSCPPQSAPKCKLGQGSLPQAPNLLRLVKNSVAPSHRGKQAGLNAALSPRRHHQRHRRRGSSHLCNFFSVLTHSGGTIYTLLPFNVA